MTLDFSYDMQVSFSVPVTEHHYAIMCLPKDTARQRIRTLYLTVSRRASRISTQIILKIRSSGDRSMNPIMRFG